MVPHKKSSSDKQPIKESQGGFMGENLKQEHSPRGHAGPGNRQQTHHQKTGMPSRPPRPPYAQPQGAGSPNRNAPRRHPRHKQESFKTKPKTGGLIHRTGVRTPDHEAKAAEIKNTPIKPNTLRYVPLGGLEEVGRNMMFFEYNDEIVIIDAGLQFPEEETPGIDYIIPNTAYLESKKENIKGLILTHGHLDHVGAIPYIIEKIGNPIIYGTGLTNALVAKKHEEFPNLPKLKMHGIKNGDRVKIGKYFEAEFFGVAHNIPDTTGVLLKTPVGNMVHFADFKLDYDINGNAQGLDEFARIATQGIHTLMLDSTNATKIGHSLSERVVEKNLEELFTRAEGRIIIATFSSLLTRIAEIIKIGEAMGRRIFLNGYSMKANVQIAQNLGFIKKHEGTLLPIEELSKYKDNKVIILTTGAQGESNAGLMKIVNGEHRFVGIKPGDTVVFSSSVIAGNERNVQILQDNLSRQGAIVYNSAIMDIHSSGHAPKNDLQMVMKTMKPRFLLPVHGYYFMRAANCQSGREVGIPKENLILMDNGQVAEMSEQKITITQEQIPSFYIMVDGLGVGDVEEVVLRDRRMLAAEGMVVIILILRRENGRLAKNPDIISRGFIHLKENQEVLQEIRKKTVGAIDRLPQNKELELDYVRGLIRDQIGAFIFNKTKRRPMIIPVIIEV